MAENMPFKPSQTVAGLNMDALSYAGKARDIIIIGYGASELEPIMEKHAAKEDKYLAIGGRVLNVIVTTENFKNSKDKAIKILNDLDWKDGFFRKDIAYKVT